MRTADQIMERMGFPATEGGPCVSELRKHIARQIENHGLVDQSPGSWSAGDHSHEDRAKALLAMDWARERGYHFRCEAIDGFPVHRTFNTKTMRSGIEIDWHQFGSWIGDRWREFRMMLRIWRDRYILRISNPYD